MAIKKLIFSVLIGIEQAISYQAYFFETVLGTRACYFCYPIMSLCRFNLLLSTAVHFSVLGNLVLLALYRNPPQTCLIFLTIPNSIAFFYIPKAFESIIANKVIPELENVIEDDKHTVFGII